MKAKRERRMMFMGVMTGALNGRVSYMYLKYGFGHNAYAPAAGGLEPTASQVS